MLSVDGCKPTELRQIQRLAWGGRAVGLVLEEEDGVFDADRERAGFIPTLDRPGLVGLSVGLRVGVRHTPLPARTVGQKN